MLTNILILIVLVLLAAGLILLARAAWRSRRAIVRWPVVIVSGLLALIMTVFIVVAGIGLVRLNSAPYAYSTTASIPVTGASDQVERGAQKAVLCAGCHSSNGQLPLDGSAENFLDGGPPFGTIWASNLTPGGPLKDWTDAEIARAIREGVDKDGRPLLIMPSKPMHNLSDADTAALIAYLRSQPAVKRDLPETQLNILGAALIGSGMFTTSAQPPITQPIENPPPGTAENGHYLVYSVGCIDCHGDNLAGIPPGGFGPSGPNLTVIVPNWEEEDFVTFFRTGVDPTGHQVSNEQMPLNDFSAALTDDELKDMYKYLSGLQELPTNQ